MYQPDSTSNNGGYVRIMDDTTTEGPQILRQETHYQPQMEPQFIPTAGPSSSSMHHPKKSRQNYSTKFPSYYPKPPKQQQQQQQPVFYHPAQPPFGPNYPQVLHPTRPYTQPIPTGYYPVHHPPILATAPHHQHQPCPQQPPINYYMPEAIPNVPVNYGNDVHQPVMNLIQPQHTNNAIQHQLPLMSHHRAGPQLPQQLQIPQQSYALQCQPLTTTTTPFQPFPLLLSDNPHEREYMIMSWSHYLRYGYNCLNSYIKYDEGIKDMPKHSKQKHHEKKINEPKLDGHQEAACPPLPPLDSSKVSQQFQQKPMSPTLIRNVLEHLRNESTLLTEKLDQNSSKSNNTARTVNANNSDASIKPLNVKVEEALNNTSRKRPISNEEENVHSDQHSSSPILIPSDEQNSKESVSTDEKTEKNVQKIPWKLQKVKLQRRTSSLVGETGHQPSPTHYWEVGNSETVSHEPSQPSSSQKQMETSADTHGEKSLVASANLPSVSTRRITTFSRLTTTTSSAVSDGPSYSYSINKRKQRKPTGNNPEFVDYIDQELNTNTIRENVRKTLS